MASRGRARIARGDYLARAYWERVAIGEAKEENTGLTLDLDKIKERHWFWMGNANGIAGVSRTTYDAPQRVLFSELRPEVWDERPKHSRVYNTCGVDDCVNPFHWQLSSRGAVPLDGLGKARALTVDELLTQMPDVDLLYAYETYLKIAAMEERDLIKILDSRNSFAIQFNVPMLAKVIAAVDGSGDIEDVKDQLTAPVVAYLERIFSEDDMMTDEEVTARMETIRERRDQGRAEVRETFLAKAASIKRRPASSPAARKVKPKPARVR